MPPEGARSVRRTSPVLPGIVFIIAVLTIVALTAGCGGGSVGYKPPALPISFHVDTSGAIYVQALG